MYEFLAFSMFIDGDINNSFATLHIAYKKAKQSISINKSKGFKYDLELYDVNFIKRL